MDVYETWLVYSCGNATYKASYAWDPELETVTLQGEPEEVTQKRVFVPKTNGGPGSGNFGHSGRKGEQGGSGGGGGGKGAATDDSFEGKHEAAFKQAADQMRIEGSRTVRQGDVFDKLMNDRSYMDAVEELVKADLGKSASEDDQRDAIDDRVSADARKIVTAFKRNESLDPRGSEQPPTWAQHEGSPSMDKLMKVNSLIENGHLNAGLRETMLAAPEAVVMAFDQLASKQVAPKTLKNMMEALPEDEKKKLADALAAKKLKDEEDAGSMKKLSDEVKANAACPFTPEQVDALSLPMLKTLAEKLPKGKANHAPGAPAGTPKANADDDAAPEMPSLDEAIKANEALRASK
jgi:hypothetical protein